MIPFNLHRRLPLVRIPFEQRDYALAQRDAALAKLAVLLQERQAETGSNTTSQAPVSHDTTSQHHHLLLAYMPKSGSDFLLAVLSSLPNFSHVPLVSNYGRREQELEPAMLWTHQDKDYIAKHAVRCSEATHELIQQWNLEPIVLVRDIFDVVVSFRDHMRNRSVVFPQAYAFPDFKKWQDARLEEFIADMIIPWYFNFYLSWYEVEPKLLITYNDLNRDPFSVVSRIKSRFGLTCSDDEIKHAIKKYQGDDQARITGKNKAIVGRGKTLSKAARDHIRRMASYYDGVDFKPIGIGV